jgi:L-alanine-DL-glutamate epimerase-like enolase superfamily enzyme
MAELAKASDLDIMVGCVFESGIAISQDVNFLAGISQWACGSDIDTDYEIKKDVISEESKISFKNGGRIPLDRPGLGLELKKWVKDSIIKSRS